MDCLFSGFQFLRISVELSINFLVNTMSKLLGDDGNLTCPILTKQVYSEEDDAPGCAYSSLAYGLFAVIAIIIVGVPFVVFICYIHRKIRNKKRNNELASQLRPESSDPDTYQVCLHYFPATYVRNHLPEV